MRNSAVFPALCLPLLSAVLLVGCESTQRQYRITSHPPGATIFIDGEPRGQTDVEKLNLNFRAKKMISLRLEKEGYQPEGLLIYFEEKRDEVFLVLKESPHNKEILEELKRIQKSLETGLARFPEAGKEKP